MVHLDRITTRTGDDGSTALGDGRRLPKDDILIQALGAIDEANAVLGCLRQVVEGTEADLVLAIQQELFDLGADLCCPPGSTVGAMVHRLGKAEVTAMEARIAAANAGVAPMTSFVLPGGTAAAAWWHLARTVVRRAERDLVGAARRGDPPINSACLQYLNRLSDLCFVHARRANGADEVLWVPASRRHQSPSAT